MIERCSSSGQFPILHQLILMQLAPCKDQLQLPPRQCTTDHTGILNIDQCLEPAVFGVSQVIPGWVEALQLMPVGSKWRLFIPSDLAYGEHGAGDAIEPNSALVFDVELLDIVK